MTAEVVTVEQHTVGQALDEIRRQALGGEDLSEAYVVDGGGNLKGVMSFKRLVLSAPAPPVHEVMEEPDVIVSPDVDQKEVARLMARYNVSAIPVVGKSGSLLGRITFDDVTDVVEAEATEERLRFGGVSGDEDLGAGWTEAVRSRLDQRSRERPDCRHDRGLHGGPGGVRRGDLSRHDGEHGGGRIRRGVDPARAQTEEHGPGNRLLDLRDDLHRHLWVLPRVGTGLVDPAVRAAILQ
jgi:CBS domain-containing protein